jgi:large subunit ribosomal protein L19
MTDILRTLAPEPNANIPADLRSGDSVRVHVRIVEGDRERVQIFQGVVISMRRGADGGSFTVRRVAAHGIGVERAFKLRSPRVEKVEIIRRAKVHRRQLYYLRKAKGKGLRLKEDRGPAAR